MLVRETDEVFKTLVSQLAYTIMPMTAMGVTIVATGLFAYESTGNSQFLLPVLVGCLASIAKIVVMLAHRRSNARGQLTVEQAARWERLHGVLTFTVSAATGWLTAAIFINPDPSAQILATGLLFGYCTGLSSRVSVRPSIAVTAIAIAAVPAIICTAVSGGAAHWLMTALFSMLVAASVQSVWYTYRNTLRQISLGLEMERQARHDPLTGLCNRAALTEAFNGIARDEATLICLHCFDLDAFKTVNDRFGHAAGDELLAAIGKRLQEFAGTENIAVRMGGDEFVVLQPALRHPADAEALAATILRRLSLPYTISGKPVTIGISLGYTIERAATADLGTMLRLADVASYRVKRQGGGIDREVPQTLDLTAVSSAA